MRYNLFKPFAVIICMMFGYTICGQQNSSFIKALYVFSSDSLDGFDENAASVSALESGCVGNEYKFYMYLQKRKYINKKYGIKDPSPTPYTGPSQAVFAGGGAKPASVLVSSGACANEDFEDAQGNPGAQIGGAVNGRMAQSTS